MGGNMKYIKIITLSIIVLVLCLNPVIPAELNENGNDTNLTVDDTISLNNQNALGMKRPNLHIDSNDVFKVGEDLKFEVSYDILFDKPVTLYLDDEYWTTVDGYVGYFIIKIGNPHLCPGQHTVTAKYDGDSKWLFESYTKEFTIQ